MKISWVSVDFDELFVDNILDNREEELENWNYETNIEA
jgi:hypothetical protein